MRIQLTTTAVVLALPISKEPPFTKYPKYAPTLLIMKEYVYALYIAKTMLCVFKLCLKPTSKVEVERIPERSPPTRPPQMASVIEIIISAGITKNAPAIFGKIK